MVTTEELKAALTALGAKEAVQAVVNMERHLAVLEERVKQAGIREAEAQKARAELEEFRSANAAWEKKFEEYDAHPDVITAKRARVEAEIARLMEELK